MTRAEPSRAEPRRRNRGGERHDGGATTGSIIEKNGFSNASQLEEEMEEEKEEAYGDDLLRQLRRRTSFRWIGEEPWRDNEGTVASFEGCCSLPRRKLVPSAKTWLWWIWRTRTREDWELFYLHALRSFLDRSFVAPRRIFPFSYA